MYKRSKVQSLPILKTDWCLDLMIRELSLGVDALGWNSLKKKKIMIFNFLYEINLSFS